MESGVALSLYVDENQGRIRSIVADVDMNASKACSMSNKELDIAITSIDWEMTEK